MRAALIALLIGLAAVHAQQLSRPITFEIFCGAPFADGWASGAHKVIAGISEAVFETASVVDPSSRFFYERLYDKAPDGEDAGDCLTLDTKRRLERYAGEIMARYLEMGFAVAPERIGPVVRGRDGTPVVRLYVIEQLGSIANTSSPCIGGRAESQRAPLIRLDRERFQVSAHPQLYHWLAHELFHVVQFAQRSLYLQNPCGPDAWVYEGTAEAVSLYLTRQKFPNWRPGATGYGKNWYGLRAYHRSFAAPPGELAHYFTSSFWRYLAERYYQGEYGFLQRYFARSSWQHGVEDSLAWLEHHLRHEPAVTERTQGGLYLIFPEFLTQFATWGRARFPELEQFWLLKAFNGCHTVTLSREAALAMLEPLNLEPLSGRCLKVRVSGLAPQELAALKVMAFDDELAPLDNLHLGMAASSAQHVRYGPTVLTEAPFDCYAVVRRFEGSCLEKPFTGNRGGVGAAAGIESNRGKRHVKTWLSLPQIVPESGAFETLFVITHSPPEPNDAAHARRSPQRAWFSVGLEVSRLERGGDNAGGERPHRRVQGKVVNPAASNQDGLGVVPMQGGESSALSAAQMMSPDYLSQMFFLMPGMPAAPPGRGVTAFEIEAVTIDPYGELEPTVSFQVTLFIEGIPFGATGSYRGMATGLRHPTGGPEDAYFPLPNPATGEFENGTVTVVRYDEELLHVRLEGEVCRWGNLLRNAQGTVTGCRQLETFSGEIIKPFGWLYDSEQTFTSIDTPGMQLYRQDLMAALSEMPFVPVSPGAPGPSDNADDDEPTFQDPFGAAPVACDCSCDAFAHLQGELEALEALQTQLDPMALMERAAPVYQCLMECMMDFVACEVE
jgi:hypothetical protein